VKNCVDGVLLMGLHWLRQGMKRREATRKAMRVMHAKLITANDERYLMAA